MRELTQSNTSPGNCWQTALACILDLDADKLPPQVEIEADIAQKVLDGWGSFRNVLNAYLTKHHNLTYFDLQPYQWGAVILRRREHVMVGPTVRTAGHGMNHAIVGRDGYAIWDPHPSRAGLTKVEAWGVLGPATDAQRESHAKHADSTDLGERLVWGCLCPACGLDKLRSEVVIARTTAEILREAGHVEA